MATVADLFRYTILSRDPSGMEARPIAEHGMGVVYRAKDDLLDKVVALKVVRHELFLRTRPGQSERQFRIEAMTGARLGERDMHIVKVYDVGRFEDILYMGQEWMQGGNISELCGVVTLAKARSIMLQIAAAVQTAHRAGFVHSDIAPANILHDGTGVYKLSDFGLVKLMNATSLLNGGSSLQLAGGRRLYMPGEHFDNPESINFSTDVYALAVTFYHLLAGELPYPSVLGKETPGVLPIRGERDRKAPQQVITLLNKYIVRHSNQHTIDMFVTDLSRVPA